MRPEVRQEFERELTQWVEDGWLVPYNKWHGAVKGTIPLMAVVQENKSIVRPVIDIRELNSHLIPHIVDVDICGENVREWRRRCQRIAYLQIHVDQRDCLLWKKRQLRCRGAREVHMARSIFLVWAAHGPLTCVRLVACSNLLPEKISQRRLGLLG